MKLKLAIQILVAVVGFAAGYYLDWGNVSAVRDPTHVRVLMIDLKDSPAKETASKQSFYWQQLESTNFFAFVRNLRAVQCPELTVCDIIKAELDKMFSERWRKEHTAKGSSQEARYWIPRPPQWLAARSDKNESLKYEAEKHNLLKSLLGGEGSRCSCERAPTIFPRVPFLPAEKQTAVDSILERYKGAECDLEEEAVLDEMNPDLSNRWISLIEEKRRALLTILSPAELKKLELSLSPIANHLREHSFGFQPSEQEFQAMYDFEKGLGQIRLGFGPGVENYEIVQVERKALDAALRDALGDQRFSEYQLLSRSQYRDFLDVGHLWQWDAGTLKSAIPLFQRYADLEKEMWRQGKYDELTKLGPSRDQELRSILGETRFAEFAKKRKESGSRYFPKYQFW